MRYKQGWYARIAWLLANRLVAWHIELGESILLTVTSQSCNKLKQLVTYGVSRVDTYIVTIRDTESVRNAYLNPTRGIVQGKLTR